MPESDHILILGASVRAAAFSALRAGIRPICIDLFADADLSRQASVRRIAPADYLHRLPRIVESVAAMPWIYTGALENQPAIISEISRTRPLWGNDLEAISLARSPRHLQTIYENAGLAAPGVRMRPDELPTEGTWLLKPIRGAGGIGIKHWFAGRVQATLSRSQYLQQYVRGAPCSAVYLGDGQKAQLLGATGQLVGATWLNASEFQYCGSYGPLPLNEVSRTTFQRMGTVVVRGCKLRGLFGVDAVLRAGVPWPVEVNPRYTASVEVLEHALGTASLTLHRACFEPHAGVPVPGEAKSCVGKAILYARAPLCFPEEGPWLKSLGANVEGWQMPDYADIPEGGERIENGRPILTILASGSTSENVLESLRQRASDLDRRLFGR